MLRAMAAGTAAPDRGPRLEWRAVTVARGSARWPSVRASPAGSSPADGAASWRISWPLPLAVARAGILLVASGELVHHAWVSLQELAAGFALAAVVGVSVGVALGRSRILRGLLDPVVMAFHVTPRVALLPVLVLWLGVATASKVAAVFLGGVFPIIVNTQAGAQHVDELWIRAIRAFGARPFRS